MNILRKQVSPVWFVIMFCVVAIVGAVVFSLANR
jgi:mannose/fructose/N-acetylgalactosamine-specific phosphotransferase system component IID